jgi:hypothetical protein
MCDLQIVKPESICYPACFLWFICIAATSRGWASAQLGCEISGEWKWYSANEEERVEVDFQSKFFERESSRRKRSTK